MLASPIPRNAALPARLQDRLLMAGRAALLAAALALPAAHAQLPPAQHYGQTEYVTGGIGLDESTAFKDAMAHYPLTLTFAEQFGGKAAYVSDVQVVIRDKQGNTVLNADAHGPYMLVRLAAGSYQVFATYGGRTLSRNIEIGASGGARAVFEWRDQETAP